MEEIEIQLVKKVRMKAREGRSKRKAKGVWEGRVRSKIKRKEERN